MRRCLPASVRGLHDRIERTLHKWYVVRQEAPDLSGKMNQYYDWFDQRWVSQRAVPPPGVRLRRRHRFKLLDLLHSEIEDSADAVVQIYAMMLARTLCQMDAELMREFGERIATARSHEST
jgi:hypothetical protein